MCLTLCLLSNLKVCAQGRKRKEARSEIASEAQAIAGYSSRKRRKLKQQETFQQPAKKKKQKKGAAILKVWSDPLKIR